MTDRQPPNAPSRPSACTCLRLRKATRQVTQIYDQHLAPFGLTVTQFSLLGHLQVLAGTSVGALAEVMVMDPTSLTRALRPLEAHGFIHAEPDKQDRRARRLVLTDKGAEAYRAARPGWQAAQAHLEKALGSNGPPALNAALDHLIATLRASPPDHSPSDAANPT